jgi:phosphoserine/homoserine phosphotransferase
VKLVCLDLEGVLIPEIWLGLAERTGIEELKVTTQENPDYDDLMCRRLAILKENNLGMKALGKVVAEISPLEGAVELIQRLRSQFQIVILSDTFYELAMPLMASFGWPMILCHRLTLSGDVITGYELRQDDPKFHAVDAFKKINLSVIAAGDSYNDISMLHHADAGILFRPPKTIMEDYPELTVTTNHQELGDKIEFFGCRL